MEPITRLAREFGDEAPITSSVTRAWRLYRASGMPMHVFLSRLTEAATRTRAHLATIRTRRHHGQALNGMPYLFAVLERLPDHSSAPPAPSHRGRSGSG